MRPLSILAALALTILSAAPALADPLASALAAERARPMVRPIPREAFASEPEVVSVSLAPDGHAVAFVRVIGENRSLWLQPTAPGATALRILPRLGADRIFWGADSRWLFLVDSGEVRALSVAGMRGSGTIAKLGGGTGARLLALDPWQSAALIVDQANGLWRLWRARPGAARRLVAFGRRQIVDVAIGRDGRAAFVKLLEGDHHLIVARTAGGKFRRIATCTAMVSCSLLGVTPDGRGVFMASDLLGDRRALIRLDADGHKTQIHSDPAREVDLDSVQLDRSGVPVVASYRGNAPRSYGLTPVARAAIARLNFARDTSIEVSPAVWLIRERDTRLQGSRWHWFDPVSGAHRPFLDDRQHRVDPALLASTLPFTYRASDGMQLKGLLTVPPGRDLRRATLITLVHGGPWSHDALEFSGFTQALVNRGYAVFQPQFRGSTGYGRAYVFAARGDFGDGRVQRDIEEGTRYLLGRGIGAPQRTAIMGASFGGYSTLEALSNGSHLYRVGIAIVPPTDFGWVSRYAVARSALGESQGVPFAATLRSLGLDTSNPGIARHLYQQSPRARVAAMRTPLLLIAAGRDERVPIRGVIDYAARLRAIGAPARIVVARHQTHSSKDRMAWLATMALIETTLRAYVGGPPVMQPSLEIRAWAARNLKSL